MLQKKMAAEVEKAKECMRAKNKRGALHCLKKKKMMQDQVDQLDNHILRIEEQKFLLENSKVRGKLFQSPLPVSLPRFFPA